MTATVESSANKFRSDRDRDSKDDRDDRDRRENGTNGDERKGKLSQLYFLSDIC